MNDFDLSDEAIQRINALLRMAVTAVNGPVPDGIAYRIDLETRALVAMLQIKCDRFNWLRLQRVIDDPRFVNQYKEMSRIMNRLEQDLHDSNELLKGLGISTADQALQHIFKLESKVAMLGGGG